MTNNRLPHNLAAPSYARQVTRMKRFLQVLLMLAIVAYVVGLVWLSFYQQVW